MRWVDLSVAIAVGLTVACDDRGAPPVVDPVIAAMEHSTKAGAVGLFVLPEKVVVVNRTEQAAADCVAVLAGTYRGDIGALQPGRTVTLMRSRFRPYVEAEAFYATSQQANRLECTTAHGPVVVRFGAPFEQTVPAR